MLEKLGLILGAAACVPGIIALTIFLNGRSPGIYVAAAVGLVLVGEILMITGARNRKKALRDGKAELEDPKTT